MKWLRLYHELLDDPKIQRMEPTLFKFWVNFLCLANQGTPRGVVTKSVEEIAFALRVSDEEAVSAIAELQRLGLLETVETGITPHNWEKRQQKSDDVTARVTAHRSGRKPPAPPETLGETLPETLPTTEKPSRATELELEKELETNGTPSQAAEAAAAVEEPPEKPAWTPKGPAQELVAWWADYSGSGLPAMFDKAVGAASRLLKAGLTAREAPVLFDYCAQFQDGVTLQKMAGQYDSWRASLVQPPGRASPGRGVPPPPRRTSPAAPYPVPSDRELTDDERAAAAERWLGRTGTTP